MRSKLVFVAVAWLIPCALNVARAQLVTFETTPGGGTPVDDATLAAPYNFAGGSVQFFFDTNGNKRFDAATDVLPVFEHIGRETNNGFQSTFTGVSDTARPGYTAELGTYFLRQPSPVGALPGPFIAHYTTLAPIRELSGEIWDIDGTVPSDYEQWRVDVLDGAGDVLASELSPRGAGNDAASLDSLPWVFQFTDLPDDVSAVQTTYVGTKSGVGLAFNNFSPDVAVPEPGGAAAVAAALLLTALLRRNRVLQRF